MKAKQILFEQQVKEKLLAGVNTVVNAVATTLGPRGRNVGIAYTNPQGEDYEHKILHDGVSVAEAVFLKDKYEDFGAQVVKQAAKKQLDLVGDGTSVTMILAQAIFSECIKIISTGINAMSLVKGLEAGTVKLIAELDKISKPLRGLEEKIQIATISAEDEQLGVMIGETLHEIGTDGIITVEESKSAETIVEHQEGMQFDSGYKNRDFVTDTDKMEATVEDAYILLSDKTVSNILELQPFLEKFVQVSKNLVIIAPDITDSALYSFAITKINGGMNISCIKTPSIKQQEWLEDIAILTGGTVFSGERGMKFESMEITQLGKAKRVTSTKDTTLIVTSNDWGGKKADIDARVASLRSQLEKEEDLYEQEKLKERIAKLGKGVAVIKVGGFTDIEMKERKERAIDSVAATKAAIEEGIVAGGEIVYLQALGILDDANIAEAILKRALRKPFDKLMQNTDLDAGEKYQQLKQNLNKGYGVDVTDGLIKDMVEAGIVDPVKVAKCAVQNAVSVAIKLMTVDVLIVDLPEEKKEK